LFYTFDFGTLYFLHNYQNFSWAPVAHPCNPNMGQEDIEELSTKDYSHVFELKTSVWG
jgi:hypothetical protein